MTKICITCKIEKPLEDFGNRKDSKDGLNPYCKLCWNARSKRMYYQNPEYAKNYHIKYRASHKLELEDKRLMRSYGITFDALIGLLKDQDNRCAICPTILDPKTMDGKIKQNRPHIDHDHKHKYKNIRGVLCGKCNTGLGLFGEDINRLKSAIKYLEAHGANIS